MTDTSASTLRKRKKDELKEKFLLVRESFPSTRGYCPIPKSKDKNSQCGPVKSGGQIQLPDLHKHQYVIKC